MGYSRAFLFKEKKWYGLWKKGVQVGSVKSQKEEIFSLWIVAGRECDMVLRCWGLVCYALSCYSLKS